MADPSTMQILITENGPYLVSGDVPLGIETIVADAEGNSAHWDAGKSIEHGPKYALCRCGMSSTKPFCDGTHAKQNFDGTETASLEPYAAQASEIPGPVLDLYDAEPLCAFARFCDNGGGIWDEVTRSDDAQIAERVQREGGECPSGRLVVKRRGTDGALEPSFAPSIGLVEDPSKACSGPIWVRGGIAVRSHTGTVYETRNRVTLCRCGASSNKPFCDGTHADTGFKDGL